MRMLFGHSQRHRLRPLLIVSRASIASTSNSNRSTSGTGGNNPSTPNSSVTDTVHTVIAAGTDATKAIAHPLPEKSKVATKEAEQGYRYGTYPWTMERVSAICLIPLLSTQFIYGAHSICDGLLGVVLPFHISLGLESCIIDYIPKRTYPRLHRASNWILLGTTGFVMWGCYEFNTNEIGLTEVIRRMWTA